MHFIMSSFLDYTHSTFIGHKKLFKTVANYSPKTLAKKQKQQPGCLWDNNCYFLKLDTDSTYFKW